MGRPRILPTLEEKIEELKEWFGWDAEMIEIARQGRALAGIYKIMQKEKGDNGFQNTPTG